MRLAVPSVGDKKKAGVKVKSKADEAREKKVVAKAAKVTPKEAEEKKQEEEKKEEEKKD